eukprot:1743273-Lingulodinium_polyedra.AAC.1
MRRRGPRWPAKGAVIVLPQTGAHVALRGPRGNAKSFENTSEPTVADALESLGLVSNRAGPR